MLTVSVNAYDDADLLEGCLASVRERLPHARIQVIDGRYETFTPDAADNSTDGTAAVAAAYGAEYWPDGPFEDEAAKHWGRLERAPDGGRVLFIDADERLVTFDGDAIPDDTVGRVRIHNALMYGEGDVTYYPRLFYPEMMEDIPRVDRFSFDAPVERTDAITLTHRADLRSDAYREAKLKRFEREDRDPWYAQYLEALGERGHVAEFYECPACGEQSLTRSRVCGYGRERTDFSRVETCTRADGCHAAVVPVEWDGEFRYVPDDLAAGFEDDIERVRLELMAAGNNIARVCSPEALRRYEPNARVWCDQRESGVFV